MKVSFKPVSNYRYAITKYKAKSPPKFKYKAAKLNLPTVHDYMFAPKKEQAKATAPVSEVAPTVQQSKTVNRVQPQQTYGGATEQRQERVPQNNAPRREQVIDGFEANLE